MPWPTPQDYNEAIQSPRLSFADHELQTGQPQLTPLGIPRPITGNFASVYRVTCATGDWAVRCFFREFADMQDRYAAISAHLGRVKLPYTVGFEYQPRGIRVRNEWYPILKMEWVEGQLLHDHLATHLLDAPALLALAERWREMVAALERAGCAHGDLQHGNVLLRGEELKLVDYDGMYVPGLAGRGSHELGHQNFQHPSRGESHFGPGLDRFAAWVIYLSVIAVRADPDLWTAAGAGDECLLLRRNDFEHPETSATFRSLLDHADPQIRDLAARFRAALAQPPNRFPALPAGSTPDAPGVARRPNARVPTFLALLWRDLVPQAPECPHAQPVTAPAHPEWLAELLVAEHSGPPTDVGLDGLRAGALGALLPAAVAAAALSSALVPAAAAGLALLLWLLFGASLSLVVYRRQPAVRDLLPLVRRETALLRRQAALRRARRRLERRRDRLRADEGAGASRAAERLAGLERRRERDRAHVEMGLQRRTEVLDARLRSIDRREEEEASEALEALRLHHVEDALRRASVRHAQIPGVGRRLKLRLLAMGVWSAADLTSDRITAMSAVGREAVLALVSWRVEEERRARRSMPAEIAAGTRARLRARHMYDRSRILGERDAAELAARRSLAEIEERFERWRSALQERAGEDAAEMRARCDELERRIGEAADEEERVEELLAGCRQGLRIKAGPMLSAFLCAAYLPAVRRKREPSGGSS